MCRCRSYKSPHEYAVPSGPTGPGKMLILGLGTFHCGFESHRPYCRATCRGHGRVAGARTHTAGAPSRWSSGCFGYIYNVHDRANSPRGGYAKPRASCLGSRVAERGRRTTSLTRKGSLGRAPNEATSAPPDRAEKVAACHSSWGTRRPSWQQRSGGGRPPRVLRGRRAPGRGRPCFREDPRRERDHRAERRRGVLLAGGARRDPRRLQGDAREGLLFLRPLRRRIFRGAPREVRLRPEGLRLLRGRGERRPRGGGSYGPLEGAFEGRMDGQGRRENTLDRGLRRIGMGVRMGTPTGTIRRRRCAPPTSGPAAEPIRRDGPQGSPLTTGQRTSAWKSSICSPSGPSQNE